MSAPIVGFFNNKGGVGKTSLVYHLAWMYADLGQSVLAVDLDPQANLTAAFLVEDELEALWAEPESKTIFGAIEPLIKGTGDVLDTPHVESITDRLSLMVGSLSLAGLEDDLSQQWPLAGDGRPRAFRVLSAFWRVIERASLSMNAQIVLMDLGPNLGAINRAALIACDHVVIPLAPDLFSLQGLRNLGPTVAEWTKQWQDRRQKNKDAGLILPNGRIEPLGYVVLQHGVRADRPARAYGKWMRRIPAEYARAVDGAAKYPKIEKDPSNDSSCLGLIKHYRSLVPMAQEARKPMFHLLPADGALGAHLKGVQIARANFQSLAEEITRAIDIWRQVNSSPEP